ncbi:MAG: hypothetical protein ACE5JX_06295, partial [Acidobacteriota bacterium]
MKCFITRTMYNSPLASLHPAVTRRVRERYHDGTCQGGGRCDRGYRAVSGVRNGAGQAPFRTVLR